MNDRNRGNRLRAFGYPGKRRAEGYERFASAPADVLYEPSERYYVDAGVHIGLNGRLEDYG
jgi:hypothetical protein